MNKIINKPREIVIDTGPLLVYIAMDYGHNTISKFTDKDSEIMLREFFQKISKDKIIFIITPQVLAEISNLVNTKIEKQFFSDFIKFSKKILLEFKEEYISKDAILANEKLQRFGFTDVSLLEVAKRNRLILTNDRALYFYCISNDIPSFCPNDNNAGNFSKIWLSKIW